MSISLRRFTDCDFVVYPLLPYSSKFQIVIPEPVRRRLGLKTGDVLRFSMTDERLVTVEKVRQGEDDPFTSFVEWRSEEDERLYRDL